MTGKHCSSSPGDPARAWLATQIRPQDLRAVWHRKQCNRTWKRGKRGGVCAKLRANPKRPALLSILLAETETETWMHKGIPDLAVQLAGCSLLHWDRDATKSGKKRGGGVCIYINNELCTNAAAVYEDCSAALNCLPFFLPWESSSVVLLAVYLPPSTNTNQALAELYDAVTLQTAHPKRGFYHRLIF